MIKAEVKQYAELHFIVFIWGFTGILGALISISALPLVFWRVVLAVTILNAWQLVVRKFYFKIESRLLPILAAQGLTIAFHWFCFYHAIKVSSVSLTLACYATASFFAALFEPIFYKRKIRVAELLLGITAVVAVFILFSTNPSFGWGIVWALLAAASSSWFAVINGRLVQKQDALMLTQYELWFALLGLAVAMPFLAPDFLMHLPKFSDWGLLLVLAGVCTIYPFLRSIVLTKQLNPFTVILSINMEPVYGIIMAVLFLGERKLMNEGFYWGTGLILASILTNAYYQHRLKRAGKV